MAGKKSDKPVDPTENGRVAPEVIVANSLSAAAAGLRTSGASLASALNGQADVLDALSKMYLASLPGSTNVVRDLQASAAAAADPSGFQGGAQVQAGPTPGEISDQKIKDAFMEIIKVDGGQSRDRVDAILKAHCGEVVAVKAIPADKRPGVLADALIAAKGKPAPTADDL